jgi:tRNA A-37 threonylcarbamoyl transferase component Bud32
MESDVGELIDEAADREVRRLRFDGFDAYLKRVWNEPAGRVAKAVFRFAPPRTAALREVTLLHRLHAAGIPAARPLAWGQAWRWGLPRDGFILTQAVPGKSLSDCWRDATPSQRGELSEQLGSLLGVCHRAGFYHVIRMKDVIVEPTGRFVLIDREVAGPWAKRPSASQCVRGLSRSLAKMRRAGEDVADELLEALWNGYLPAVASVAPRAIIEPRVAASLDRIMRHRRYRKG